MKLLIGTQHIDLALVTQIDVLEKETPRLNDSGLRLYFFGDNRIIDLRLDLSKLRIYKNSDEVIEDIKGKVSKENLITREEIQAELDKYCGGFTKYYLVEDVREVWNTFKDDILDKWNKTESAIKDIQIYK